MSIRPNEGAVQDLIPVRNVLVSVSDKSGMEDVVRAIVEANDGVRFFSTGGTYTSLQQILGPLTKDHLFQVSDYTDFPEMDGGLVKTLHPIIHAGILGERNNPKHAAYLANLGKKVRFLDEIGEEAGRNEMPARVFDATVGAQYKVEVVEGIVATYIDMVIVNLYPFSQTVADLKAGKIDKKTNKPYNSETARGNIDIGGPCMVRGAAKNFLGCAVVCDPSDYGSVIKMLSERGGTRLEERFAMAAKVFRTTGKYDTQIANFMEEQLKDPAAMRRCYQMADAVRGD